MIRHTQKVQTFQPYGLCQVQMFIRWICVHTYPSPADSCTLPANDNVQQVSNSRANMCNNCAFHDKSMKLCTVLKHYMKRIIGYRDIADMSYEENGHRFFKMAINSIVNAITHALFMYIIFL